MDKKVFLEEVHISAFKDELEKISFESTGRRKIPLYKSFVAGVDPTGGKTFQISQQAKRHGAHQTVGVAGGVVGGIALVPSMISGLTSGVKGFIRNNGGIRKRVVGAVRGFGQGAISPYSHLYRGLKAGRSLKNIERTGNVGVKDLYNVKKFLRLKSLPGSITLEDVAGYYPMLKNKKYVSTARRLVSDQTGKFGAGLVTAGVIGGGSSFIQYGQGRKVGDREIALINKYKAVTSK